MKNQNQEKYSLEVVQIVVEFCFRIFLYLFLYF